MSERYHHGNLRQALVDEALHVLREEGPNELSLRAVAARAGVSRSAPYHHFADKEGLLAAVIEYGFHQLFDHLQAASRGPGTVLDRLRVTGEAYVGFALREPSLYRLMFGSTTEDPQRYPAMVEAGHATYGVLLTLIVEGQQRGEVQIGDPEVIALMAWSTCHGIASLILDKNARLPEDPSCPTKIGAVEVSDPRSVIRAVLASLEFGLRTR